MSKKIVIDPGHGGDDPGAMGFGLQEKNLTLDIAVKLREKLANYADVKLTRTGDTSVSLSERAAQANRMGADFFISLHVNAGGGTGFESYIYTNAGAETQRIGQTVHNEVAGFYAANGFPDRGLKKAGYTVLKKTLMPALLLENLFLDRQSDSGKLKDPVFRQNIAAAIANGVIKALNLQEQPEQPGPPPHWAREDFIRLVQAGLVKGQHNLDTAVTWGEMSAVLARLLDKLGL